MAPPVIFPNAAAVCTTFLRSALATRGQNVTVATRIPNPRPDRLVVAHRIGGPRRNAVVDDAMISFECWAPTHAAAHDLAALVRALVFSMRGQTIASTSVYRVIETAGPADVPDPTSQVPRYVWTATVSVRGRAL